jgi:phosphoglycerate dehydrogenase-like enzyme
VPKYTIFITSPLEAVHVETIRRVAAERADLVYQQDLLPPIRYIADHTGPDDFKRTPEQQQRWYNALSEADILWDLPRDPADMAAAKRVKWIQGTSTGIGQTVKELGLQHSDIILTTARGVHARPLAEFVFMGLLTHFRGLRQLEAEQRTHRWIRTCNEEVAGKTIVTIGAGDLARGVAKIARAFDMHVIAIARDAAKVRASTDLFDAIDERDRLHDALSHCDAVVITVPHTSDTENMIDAKALATLKPGAALVNIGRGAVIDEAAMIAALQSGQIGFACLDVAAVEPLPADSPLWDMPNVLISPHSASTVTTENEKITSIFCSNLELFLDNKTEKMINIFDKALLY